VFVPFRRLKNCCYADGIERDVIMISAEYLVGEELAEWYALTPMERWRESAKLWELYRSMGGSLDPEPDTQSPFFDSAASGARPVDGRSGLHPVRGRRVQS
jgi:hypothetical protein